MDELGYITLKEAEKLTGIKADTLKKRCQEGQIRGAIKRGKAWFVPSDELVQLPHLQQDLVLRTLVSMAEAGMQFPMTFLVKGNYIAGVVVGRKEYYKELREAVFMGLENGNVKEFFDEDLMGKVKNTLNDVLFNEGEKATKARTRNIHLKNCMLLQGGNRVKVAGGLYRIRINSIDGFSYGADEMVEVA